MKKFTKICLTAALILILVGGTICTIGEITGGWKLAREMEKDNTWLSFVRKMPAYYSHGFVDLDDLEELAEVKDALEGAGLRPGSTVQGNTWETHHEPSHGQEHGQGAEHYTDTGIRAADVKNLKIETGLTALYVMESEDDCFGIRIEGTGEYRYYEKKSTFHLEGGREAGWHLGGGGEEVYLYLPKGMYFQDVDIEIGAGAAEVTALNAEEVEVTVGAGGFDAGEITCRDLSVETGAGKAVLARVTAEGLKVENDLGSTYVCGSVGRSIDATCSMGQVELALAGREEDFNYDISCAMGSIGVGDKNYGTVTDSTRINNNAPGKCKLECSMGKIILSFTE